MNDKYCNLHCHTYKSLLDGYGTPEMMVARAKELGQVAIGITEHGNMSSVLEVSKACNKHGVKHVIGNELYITPWGKDVHWRRDDGKRSGTAFHLTCWAYNQTGYQNLLKLTQLSNKVGFYYVPRIDYGMLEQYNEGLIVTSGCLAGAIPRALNPLNHGVKGDDYFRVNNIMSFMMDIFGKDRYYIELQDHDIPELRNVNLEMSRVNDHYGFEYLATNDSHYANPGDAIGQAHSLCVSAKCSYVNPSDFVRGYIDHPDYYLTSYEQMVNKRYGIAVPDSAFTNTVKIANMVEDIKIGYEPDVKKYRFPVMDEYKHDYYGELEEIVRLGFIERYGKLVKGDRFYDESLERVGNELSIIQRLGFSSYFLCVYDIKQFCDKWHIPMTVRGSAGGSIVLYCLGVTDFCPLEYNLIFERFLNPDRVSAPDADLDIAPSQRVKVIKYIEDKYGTDMVAQVVTFSHIKGRGAIRDATRLCEAPYHVGDNLVSKMSDDPKITVSDTISRKSMDYVEGFAETKLDEMVVNAALLLEGQVRSVGIHAGAVLLSDRPLVMDYPLMRPKSTSKSVTELLVGIDYGSAEELGGIKLDILGVEALGILYEAMRLINFRHNTSYTFDSIPVDDPASYDLICRGELSEIFQLSGYAARSSTETIKPRSVIDVMVANSICRPGPNKYEQTYADRANGKAEVTYKHPDLAEALADTQGIMLYQESVMRVSQIIAGFSGSQADILRKAISKKSGFEKVKGMFVSGARNNGYDDDFIESIWGDMVEFAGYGFNMAHSCAYARIAVKQAYLKAHYPKEYYSAALTGRYNNDNKLHDIMDEMHKVGIKLLPPRLGVSEPVNFGIDDDGLRYPYGAVKNVGKAGSYLSQIKLSSLYDLTDEHLGLFKKSGKIALENLALVGTFDHLFGGDRNLALSCMPYLSRGVKPVFQVSINDDTDNKYSDIDFLRIERELTGFYLTGHPLDSIHFENKVPFGDQSTYEGMADKAIIAVGVIGELNTHRDSRGNLMLFMEIEDKHYDKMSVVVFASLYAEISERLKLGHVVRVFGRINVRYGKTNEEESKLKKYGRVSIVAENIIKEGE